jgi:integrase
MARPGKPWFRASKGTWYVTVDGKKVSLGVKGEDNEKAAIKAWHRLMAGLPVEAEPEPPQEPMPEAKAEPVVKAEGEPTVAEIVKAFLADAEGRVKTKTLAWYRDFLEPFSVKHGRLKADALTPVLAEGYARKPEWSDSTRHDFLGTLAGAFKWAVRARLIQRSPVDGLRRPVKASRGAEALISPEEHARLCQGASPQFRLFLQVLYAVGCRPGEAAAITADNFDAEAGVVCLKAHKTAHKGKSRTLYLTPDVVALLVKQQEQSPTGPLLRNRNGKPWTEWAIVKAMKYAREKAGISHAIAYGLRHSFATDALEKGVPDAQVAELLGHSGTAMLHKHYAHLSARQQALKDALSKVR